MICFHYSFPLFSVKRSITKNIDFKELAEQLAEMARRDDPDITPVGLCTDICVVSSALLIKAFLPETPVRVIAECCAGVTPESHQAALNTMKMCQIQIQ